MNKKLHYILKGIKHIKDEEYVDFFLQREYNPMLLEFESRGTEYTEKPFCIIRENGNGWGFFAEFHSLLDRMIFAELLNMTPVVVWKDKFLYYENGGVDGTINAYEYFFNQPAGYREEDIQKARLVTYSKSLQAPWIEKAFEKGPDLSEQYKNRLAQAYRKYISFNQKTEEKLQEAYQQLIQGKKTIGVHYRGTDFKANYDGHPVNVKVEQDFEAINEAMENNHFEQIFLATDDAPALAAFKKEYGEKVVCFSDVVRGDTNKSVAFSESNRSCHHYKLAFEVLRDMYILSQCDGLIAGISQVSIIARVAKAARNEEYSYLKIIDNGKNRNNKKFTVH